MIGLKRPPGAVLLLLALVLAGCSADDTASPEDQVPVSQPTLPEPESEPEPEPEPTPASLFPGVLIGSGEMATSTAEYEDADGFRVRATVTAYGPVVLSEADGDTLLSVCDPFVREQNTGVHYNLFSNAAEDGTLEGAIGQAFELRYESIDQRFPFPFADRISTEGKYAGGSPGPLLVPGSAITGLDYNGRPRLWNLQDSCLVSFDERAVHYIGFATLWAPVSSPNNPDSMIQANCEQSVFVIGDPIRELSDTTIVGDSSQASSSRWEFDEPGEPFSSRCSN